LYGASPRQRQLGKKPLIANAWVGILAVAAGDDARAEHIFNTLSQSRSELDYWGAAFSEVGGKNGFEAGRQTFFQTRSWKLTDPLYALVGRRFGRRRSSDLGQSASVAGRFDG
jgi:hypothetical protein